MKRLQQTIQSLLDGFVEQGVERGVQLTIYFQGEPIFDSCSGTIDSTSNRAVQGDTLFPVFSTTKGIAATLIHLLVERGRIEYDTPIADVWPEFAAHGKSGIRLRHALNHTAGLANMPMGLSHSDLGDWDTMCARLADEKPLSLAGEEMIYHAITYGWLLGEVACRLEDRSFPEILRKEMGQPLGVANEMFVGLPAQEERRVARLEAPAQEATEPVHDPQAIPALVQPLHEWMNRSDARLACLPASNGIMTARAIARHYAALLPGGVDGVELLPPERVRQATQLQRPGHARPEEPPMRQALGYQLGSSFSADSFGHGGFGGSTGFADGKNKLAVGFTRNYFSPHNSLSSIMEALRQELMLV